MEDLRPGLVRATLETLSPIVERLLELGVPFGTLQLGLRELFVHVAEAKLAKEAQMRILRRCLPLLLVWLPVTMSGRVLVPN